MTTSSLDAGARRQVDEVVALIYGVFAGGAAGVYLCGSAVVGGLKPSSDLDILVVSRRPSTAVERGALLDRLLGISGSRATAGPARSIELTIVVQGDVRPWRYPPTLDFQYGDWWRAEFERGDLAPWESPNPDLAVLLTSARTHSESLMGPDASELLDDIPREDLDRAMVDGVPGLLADLDSDTRNVLLTLARIWRTLATGEIVTKDAAADWALERLPPERRAVLERARSIYLGKAEESFEDLQAEVRPLAERMVREINTLDRWEG